MTYLHQKTAQDYDTSHCWYYLLGGAVLSPKQIRNNVRRSGYQGYAARDINAAARKAEPQRSAALRRLRDQFKASLMNDLAIYRCHAVSLRRYRLKTPLPNKPECAAGIHVAISLKHNHLVNDFAHLITIDDLLSQQQDLFGV